MPKPWPGSTEGEQEADRTGRSAARGQDRRARKRDQAKAKPHKGSAKTKSVPPKLKPGGAGGKKQPAARNKPASASNAKPAPDGKIEAASRAALWLALGVLIGGVLMYVVGGYDAFGGGQEEAQTFEGGAAGSGGGGRGAQGSPSADSIPGSGTFLVGDEVSPGTYTASKPVASSRKCSYRRIAESGKVIEERSSSGRLTIEILDGDYAVETEGCTRFVAVAF